MSNSEVTLNQLTARVDELEAELVDQTERVEAAETERDEYVEDLKRLAAEFDNFRKRSARERDAMVQRANGRLIRECLGILDDLERALEAAERPAPDAGSSSAPAPDATVVEGVALVEKRLRGLLEKEGVREIETDGTFDPHVHEALLTQPSEDAEGTIVGVMQKGYVHGDMVLRAARVAVAGPLGPSNQETTDTDPVAE